MLDIRTPALILDRNVLNRNVLFAANKANEHGVKLRPHLKTAKSPDVARIATKGHFGGITVSTLREAEYFFEHGVTDVTYAICVSPAKLQDVMELRKRGLNLHIITDDVQVARQITNFGMRNRCKFSVFIEVDSGYGRSGVLPTSEALLDIAKILHESWIIKKNISNSISSKKN